MIELKKITTQMVLKELLSLLNTSHLLFVSTNQKTFCKCYQCTTRVYNTLVAYIGVRKIFVK